MEEEGDATVAATKAIAKLLGSKRKAKELEAAVAKELRKLVKKVKR